MGRSKELLEQLSQQVTEDQEVYMNCVQELRKQRDEAKAATDVWKSRWHSLDDDFQDLADEFNKIQNELEKINAE